MPVSASQLSANRANAKLSRGPVTPEGKKISSQNALRHGITAQTTVMTGEDRLHHDAFCAEIMQSFAAVGPVETFLASAIAEDAWRLNNIRAQCNNIVSIGHFDGTGDQFDAEHPEIQSAITSASATRDNAKTLQLLSLYEQRTHRLYEKNTERLASLQAERKAARAKELEEASRLYQLAVTQDLSYDPAADGFVFSTAEIVRYTERFYRVKLAGSATGDYWKKHSGHFDLPKAA